jgi:hypothetical protein
MKLFFNALALVFVLFAASCTKKDCATCIKMTGGRPECSTCNLTLPFVGTQTTKFCNEDTAAYNASIAQASGFGSCTVTQTQIENTIKLEEEVCSDKGDAAIYAGMSYFEDQGYTCTKQ